ncbi:hypothetical protein BOSP111201_08660 [Bordetella sputigena]
MSVISPTTLFSAPQPVQSPEQGAIAPGKTDAPAREPVAATRPDHAAAEVFAGHMQAETAAPEPAPEAGRIPGRPAEIDAMAAVERIARQWEKDGVDPAWIQLIRSPDIWQMARFEGLPALVKLGEDLQRTGEFSTLRAQAIKRLRGTQRWQLMLDNRVAENPGIPRWRLDHQLVQELFSWKDDTPRDNTRVLDRIINARAIADGADPRPA